ncbi:MAG: glycoside hydrolase family 2 TIM barrel-domain containing protein [Mobilitalea sp.]
MREKILFNDQWKFYYGEIGLPPKTVRKAAAIGGYTAVTAEELGDIVPLEAGGHHFLNLISGGNEKLGLMMLAGTVFGVNLDDWRDITLPHDWKSELDYVENERLLMSGSKPNGIGYYRKTFTLEEDLKGKQISVCFGGILRSASVWFNGCFLGDHYSGYTSFSLDLTDMAHYGVEGDNVILVRVDTTTGDEGWWYDGAGIYRNVYLQITDSLHVKQWGVHAFTEKLEADQATLHIDSEIVNDGYLQKETVVTAYLYDSRNNIVQSQSKIMSVPCMEMDTVRHTLLVKNPELWSDETPNLYKVRVVISCEGIIIDEYETMFGIRTIEYNTSGLFLNGKRTELKGVCIHQDFAGVGTALTKNIMRFKLQRLKEMGANAYRSAHHAASEELLELCDELGILVMEENRILESSEIRLQEIESMIYRDRNHPSIIFWSISNEEVIGSTPMAERMARRIAAKIRKLDQERLLISAELLSLEGIISPAYMEIFDVIGVNYPESMVMGNGLENMKKKFPDQPFMSTENAAFFSTRGIYQDDWDKCQTSSYGSCFSMFGRDPLAKDAPGAGGTARPEAVMDFFDKHRFMGGSFVWTAFDYCGEPAPFSWPAISSQFGIMDSCGFPKDYFYYYKARWNQEPSIHLMPHWNWKAQQEIEVRVFSNCEEAELFVNGKSLGKKRCGKNDTTWEVSYEPGEIKVLGYQNNVVVTSDSKRTAGEAVKLGIRRIDSEDNSLNVGETMIAEVYAVDESGIEVPTADHLVSIKIEGNGMLLGIGNGNPADHTLNHCTERRLFSGKLAVIMQKANGNKPVKILAKAFGDKIVELEIK